MSKASEWASELDAEMPAEVDISGGVRGKYFDSFLSWLKHGSRVRNPAKELVFDRPGGRAFVACWPTSEARLSFRADGGYSHPTYTASEALALARWILDTFGEEP